MEAPRLEIGAETPPLITACCQNKENEYRRAPERWRVGRVQTAPVPILMLLFQRLEREPASGEATPRPR